MKRWVVVLIALGLGLTGVRFAFAVDMSSGNFQNNDSTFAPAVFDASSPSFQVTGSLDSIVGYSASANFNIRHGTPVKDTITTTPTTGGGGGGGTGGGGGGSGTATSGPPTPSSVKSPTLTYRSPTFLSHQVIGGTRDPSIVRIEVNGSSNGVTYPSNTTWQRDLPLFIGYNEIRVQGFDATGAASQVIGGIIERMLIGDMDRSHVVDDVDLSLFTRAWKTYTFFGDFNEDGKIDDADLSLLASHWGQRVTY